MKFREYSSCTLVILLLLINSLTAQSQTDNYWLVGGTRYGHSLPILCFYNEPPTIGEFINTYQWGMCPNYSVNSICDADGKLLFYGSTGFLFDQNHKRMPHADSVFFKNLSGSETCIVQASKTKYYVLMLYNSDTTRYPALKYCLIDMTLNNGYCDVDTTSGLILAYADSFYNTMDLHKNGLYDYWLILRDKANYFTFRIKNGIIHSPVITPIEERNTPIVYSTRMKFSHDGRFLVTCGFAYPAKYPGQIIENSGSWLYAYDFDLNTGKLSHKREIEFAPIVNYSQRNYSEFHQIEFSGNDSIYYVSDLKAKYQNKQPIFELIQYQRFAKDITSSGIRIQTNPPNIQQNFAIEYFKLGPNGKIYFSYNIKNYLGMIYYPDSIGTKCRFIEKYADFYNAIGPYHRISKSNGNYRKVAFRFKIDSCKNFVRLTNISHSCFYKFKWYIIDENNRSDSMNEKNCNYPFGGSGWYFIKLKATDSNGYSAWYSDTVKFMEVRDRTNCLEFEPELYIPNSFTPNSDGINDVFEIKGRGIVSFEAKIFDSWGILVYAFTDVDNGWDGKNMTQGIYYLQVIAEDTKEKIHNYNGIIHLIK